MYWKHSGEENWSTDESHEIPAVDVTVGSVYKCQKSDDDEVESGVVQIIPGKLDTRFNRSNTAYMHNYDL